MLQKQWCHWNLAHGITWIEMSTMHYKALDEWSDNHKESTFLQMVNVILNKVLFYNDKHTF